MHPFHGSGRIPARTLNDNWSVLLCDLVEKLVASGGSDLDYAALGAVVMKMAGVGE